jgi:hypothetical protein
MPAPVPPPNPNHDPFGQNQPQPQPGPAEKTDNRVSRMNFNRLREGMNLNEVRSIIGPGPQQLDPQNGTGMWEKYPAQPGRTRIVVSFTNGRLNSKNFISAEE